MGAARIDWDKDAVASTKVMAKKKARAFMQPPSKVGASSRQCMTAGNYRQMVIVARQPDAYSVQKSSIPGKR
jgi:hypothetical protein